MGSSISSLPVPVPVVRLPPEREGESEIIRSGHAKEGLVKTHWPEVTTLYENFQHGVKLYGQSECLGWREGDNWKWITYTQVDKRLKNFASGLIELGLKPKDFVGILSINRPEWVIVEQAANATNICLVPLYDTLGPDACKFIINQVELSLIACSKDKTKQLLNLVPSCPSIKIIVQFEEVEPEMKELAEKNKVQLYSISQVESKGAETKHPLTPPTADDLATICYTSGTTGDPKGVMLSHGNFIADAASVFKTGFEFNHDDVHLSYLPLAHVLERVIQVALWGWGVKVGFFRGDVLKLNEDIQSLKPTIFPSVPRLFNRIYDKVMSTVAQSGGLKKTIFDKAYESKKENLKEGYLKHVVWDRMVFGAISERLGGRTRFMLSGSAPISQDVLAFLRICFSCPVVEGYGQTECVGGCSIQDPTDTTVGHVGKPLPCNEIKLVDIPDMNYLATNKPYPQGEVCIRGPNVFSGYYKSPDKTAETLDSGGWLHTGDVGQIDERGNLKIIDRKKNIFKLAQGEYLAPEKLEQALITSPLVQQIFVYGDSLQSHVVAVVVPEPASITALAKELSLPNQDDVDALCKDPKVKEAYLKELGKVGKDAKFRGFEYVKNVYLHPTPMSVENDLLTPTFKIKRPQAKKAFQEDRKSVV